jgi:hypothetical protein
MSISSIETISQYFNAIIPEYKKVVIALVSFLDCIHHGAAKSAGLLGCIHG